MKIYYKLIALALALVIGTGGSLVLAQSTTPSVTTPPVGTSPRRGAAGAGLRGAPGGGQPRMELALISLQEARRSLENALPDKGGYREKAIASVDQAIKDVQAGIDYARDHPEEFRGPRGAGPRGTARGAPATVSTAPAST